MKKLLLIATALLFLACEKEDVNCNCNAKMTTFEYNSGYFYISNLPVDCKTKRPTEQTMSNFPSNYIFVKCE